MQFSEEDTTYPLSPAFSQYLNDLVAESRRRRLETNQRLANQLAKAECALNIADLNWKLDLINRREFKLLERLQAKHDGNQANEY